MTFRKNFICTSAIHIMLSRLRNAFTPPSNPSALLVLGNFGSMIYVLHLIPENSKNEHFGFTTFSSTTAFRHSGAREQAREQIGTVTLHVGDGETASSFLDDVEIRTRKLRDDYFGLTPTQQNVTQLVQDVLRPAAMDAIHERETRGPSMNATQAYPVFIVYIRRARAGAILGEPTSFPS